MVLNTSFKELLSNGMVQFLKIVKVQFFKGYCLVIKDIYKGQGQLKSVSLKGQFDSIVFKIMINFFYICKGFFMVSYEGQF